MNDLFIFQKAQDSRCNYKHLLKESMYFFTVLNATSYA